MRSRALERGMALVSALLLLLVTTILAVAMFRSFGFLEVVGGNTREKQRALHSAESAQTFAEWWLTASQGLNATTGKTCGAIVTDITKATVCSNALSISSAGTIPWTAGVSYVPPGLLTGSPGTVGNYSSGPVFYISFLGTTLAGPPTYTTTNSYQIDALGYGGTTNSAAVAESTYNVSVTYTSQDSLTKFINLGGP
jgi:type IV pilus assembly protein PilX